MDDTRNVPAYLKFETIFGFIFCGFILGFIFPAFWFLMFAGIILLFVRLFWEIKHPLTKEQKEQLKMEQAKAVENLQQAKNEHKKATAKAVKCPHCKSTDVEFMIEDRTEKIKLTNEQFEYLFDQYRESVGEKTVSELEDKILELEVALENAHEIIEEKERLEDVRRERYFSPSY